MNARDSIQSRRRPAATRVAAFAAIALALFVSMPAHAVLGGTVTSIDADQARVAGARRLAAGPQANVRVHSIVRNDGSAIDEYVSASGVVFAISWHTRFKPDLDALLGAHAPAYAVAARRAMVAPGIRRHVVLQEGDLVVDATAHLNAFVGRAYLRSMLPAGMPLDAIR